jgi:AcrR family transcriptional regulator
MVASARTGRPVNANAEQTRRRILEATMTHVAEVGYAHATMKSIAEQAGITSAAVYRYFPSKYELVSTALESITREVIGRLEEAAFSENSLRRRLVALLEESLACTRDHPAMTRFEAGLLAELAYNPQFTSVVTARRSNEEWLYGRLFTDAVRSGELPEDTSVQAMVDMFASITWGLTYLSATASNDRHQAAIRATQALLDGTLAS